MTFSILSLGSTEKILMLTTQRPKNDCQELLLVVKIVTHATPLINRLLIFVRFSKKHEWPTPDDEEVTKFGSGNLKCVG